MPFYGKVWTGATGPTTAIVLSIKGTNYGGGIRARVLVRPEFAERYFAVFVNSIYIQSIWADEWGQFDVVVPAHVGNVINSIFIEDIGRVPALPSSVTDYVAAQARQDELLTANRLSLIWDNLGRYELTAVNGDTQLSSISIEGARRYINCTPLATIKTRARLYYTIETIGSDYYVRWFDGTTLVSEGFRTGSGVVICSEVNGSGISATQTLTYTGDVQLGDAFLDLKWPARWGIYYSTSAINYASAPNDYVYDAGNERFSYITPTLTPGDYFYNVVAFDDEGDQETGSVDQGPLTVNDIPDAPVISTVTQLAPYNFRVFFTGDGGATHKIYYSNVNEPVHYENFVDGPAPVTASPPSGDIVVAPFVQQDDTADYAALESAFDSAVATANVGFASALTYDDFEPYLETLTDAVEAAVETFSDDVGHPFTAIRESLKVAMENAFANLGSIDDALWSDLSPAIYGNYLQTIGLLLKDDPQRYSLPDGTYAGTVPLTATGRSLLAIVTPLVKRNLVEIVVRSTIAGNEERNDIMYEIELDSSGNLILQRPADAFISGTTLAKSGVTRTLTVSAGVVDSNAVASTYLDLYVYTGTINLASPTQTKTLGSAIANQKTTTFNPVTLTANTWYNVSVLARTTAGGRSVNYETQKIYSGSDSPTASTSSLVAHVVRSNGN